MGGTGARFCGVRRWVRTLASFHLTYLMGRFKRTNKAIGNPTSESKHTHKTIFSNKFKVIMEEIPNQTWSIWENEELLEPGYERL